VLAVVTGYKQVRIYDTRAQRRPVRRTNLGDYPFTVVALTRDGKRLLTGDTIGTLRCVDLATLRETGVYRGCGGSVRSISVHPTLPYMATGGLDRTLRVHNIDTRQQLRRVYLKQRLTAVLFAPEGRAALRAEGEPGGAEAKGAGEEEEAGEDSESDAAGEDVWHELDRRAAAVAAVDRDGAKRGRPATAAGVPGAAASSKRARLAVADAGSDGGDGNDDDEQDEEDEDGSDDGSGFDDDEDEDEEDDEDEEEAEALVDSSAAARTLIKGVEAFRRDAERNSRKASAAKGVRGGKGAAASRTGRPGAGHATRKAGSATAGVAGKARSKQPAHRKH
jgi:hypothetical protein